MTIEVFLLCSDLFCRCVSFAQPSLATDCVMATPPNARGEGNPTDLGTFLLLRMNKSIVTSGGF